MRKFDRISSQLTKVYQLHIQLDEERDRENKTDKGLDMGQSSDLSSPSSGGF
jgi:hypothetical protein